MFATSRQSAVKAFRYEQQYRTELAVDTMLDDNDVTSLVGFAVPRLQDWNHELWIVEVEIVSPPYAIDFASA